MSVAHPLMSREDLEQISTTLQKAADRIVDALERLKEFETTEAISEFSPEDQDVMTCVTILTTRILDDVKAQFKGKKKPKKKTT